MGLQTSGAISLNDIHVEAGGTSGTSVSIGDSDVMGLLGKAPGTQVSFSEWYGASRINWVMPSGTMTVHTSGSTPIVSCTTYFRLQSDGTWDVTISGGSGTYDLHNKFLPDSPEHRVLYYKVITKGSNISGPTTSSFTAITKQVEWSLTDSESRLSNGRPARTGTLTIEMATSSSGDNAERFTITMSADATFTGAPL